MYFGGNPKRRYRTRVANPLKVREPTARTMADQIRELTSNNADQVRFFVALANDLNAPIHLRMAAHKWLTEYSCGKPRETQVSVNVGVTPTPSDLMASLTREQLQRIAEGLPPLPEHAQIPGQATRAATVEGVLVPNRSDTEE